MKYKGHAHVEPSADDDVYSNMIEGELRQDPERRGIAVIIDVNSVDGLGQKGPFQMQRDAN